MAVGKYWGRATRGERHLILPANSSLSITLNQDDMCSTTTIVADTGFEKDRMWLNGREEFGLDQGRVGRVLSEMRRLRKEHEAEKGIKEEKVRDGAVL